MNICFTTNTIAPSAIIGPHVKMGKNNHIGHYVVIEGDVTIGDNNYIAAGTIIGGVSRQRIKPATWDNAAYSDPKIIIGNNNSIFEHVTIHQPVNRYTMIMDNVSLGAHTHVGHDSIIESSVIISAHVTIGGYEIIKTASNIGMGVVIHPRCVIGHYSMLGMGAVVKGHVVPGTTVAGIPAKFKSINYIGLSRHNYSQLIPELKQFLSSPMEQTGCSIISAFHNDCQKWKKEDLQIRCIYP